VLEGWKGRRRGERRRERERERDSSDSGVIPRSQDESLSLTYTSFLYQLRRPNVRNAEPKAPQEVVPWLGLTTAQLCDSTGWSAR
jgi:hypothetical protein